MTAKIKFFLYAVLCIVQLSIPLSQIWRYENILKSGAVYKMRTAPVDPYDAFRGRYVALGYEKTEAKLKAGDKIGYGATAYVTLLKDKDGFAQYGELSALPPIKGDFLRVEYCYGDNEGKELAHFRMPFDRYYMEESKAPRAEAAYRERGNRRDAEETKAYVVLRVKDGRGVIEDLCIDDKPIREFLQKKGTTESP